MNSTRTFTYESMIAEIKSYYIPAGDYALITESHDGEIEYRSITSECWKFPGYAEMLAAKRRQGRRNPTISRSQRATLDTKYTRERVFELFREKCQNNRRVSLIFSANWFTKFVAAESKTTAGAYEYPVLLPAGDAGMFPAAHPRPTVPAELADCYDSFAEFERDVQKLWSLDECLQYPDNMTCMAEALNQLRNHARSGGYDELLPAYEKFIAACKDDALLQDADMLLKDWQPASNRDSRWYGLVRK